MPINLEMNLSQKNQPPARRSSLKRSSSRRHSLQDYCPELEPTSRTSSSHSTHFSSTPPSEEEDDYPPMDDRRVTINADVSDEKSNHQFQLLKHRAQSFCTGLPADRDSEEEDMEQFMQMYPAESSAERSANFDQYPSGRPVIQKRHSIQLLNSKRSSTRSSISTIAGLRRTRKEESLLLLQEDLINEVKESCLAEVKGSFRHTIDEWASKTVISSSTNLNREDHSSDEVNTEGAHIARAVRNFIQHLPLRYSLSIESPSEVMLHMRSLALVARNPSRPCVHVTNIDVSEELDHLAFRASDHGMSNLKRISIAVVHTLGFMEFVMGLLVSGGNDVLDIDFITSSEKIVLVSAYYFEQE